MSGCSLSCPDVNFLQEIEKLKEVNAEFKQVETLKLRQKVAYSKSVRIPDSVCHVVGSGSSIDNIDYVKPGLETAHVSKMYARAIRVALICQKKTHKNAPKLTKMAKNQAFSNTFDNIYLITIIRTLKSQWTSPSANC